MIIGCEYLGHIFRGEVVGILRINLYGEIERRYEGYSW